MPPPQTLSQNTDGLAALEAAVIQLLLSADSPAMDALREQWRASRVVSRDFTGVGFYTNFEVPESTPTADGLPARSLGDVEAEVEGLSYGAMFVLWIEDGRLDCLEGCSYQEPWPETLGRFREWREPKLAASRPSILRRAWRLIAGYCRR